MKKTTLHYENLTAEMQNLFPNQINVYPLHSFKKNICADSTSLLHQHFKTPPVGETLEKLLAEIAGFLANFESQAVYSFFYRSASNTTAKASWFLSSAKLNRSEDDKPREIVIFTYNLDLIGDSKKRLYTVLENDDFFKKHFNKVSSLTKREKEIVQLLGMGKSSQDIASEIFISVHTVNTHRKKINEKLGIKNFAGLLKIADVFDLTPNPA